ncbi:YncE family protein [Mucilaginibacter aquaedulcis]|uniref:YncE family protein n=1 Tax=Mucilaginibacter aquaedulcis TaxID=1187081 RepID=UPI0025B2D6E4|nr:DUF5074 domain-containing protein [Mucilaginibacter aquaedulcis]MDN3548649.1 hypothetical protein [Mucilaginibacter aquaedulcis]
MMQNLLRSTLIVFVTVLIGSCRKTEIKPGTATSIPVTKGLYILNVGQIGESSLSLYDLDTKQYMPDQYLTINGKPLGLTANDMEIYGSKMYIAVTNSNVVDVVNPKTGKLIKQDSLLNATIESPWFNYNKQPRSMAFYKSNVYISCYDGTVAVMDTTTLSVSTKITLPGFFYQEGLVVQNNKLYVADSGFGVTNTVSVVDLATNKEIKRIGVIPYPVSLAADAYGNVYVFSSYTDDFQNYIVSPGGVTIIDSNTDSVKPAIITGKGTVEKSSIPISINGDLIYYATGDNKIAVYNAKTQTRVTDSFVTDGTAIQYPYSICANPVSGEVYVGDAKDGLSNGLVDIFDRTGKLEYSFATGTYPVKIKLQD